MPVAKNIGQLQTQIRSQYSSLSKRLQQVATYILENNQSLAFDTIATIATQANVPPSTLIRFSKAFGFSGFNEIKQLSRQDLIEETASYTDRARLYKETQTTPKSPEKPLPILQEFARVNSEAMQQLATQTWQIHQMYAHISIENTISLKAFTSCGFKEAGFLKHWKKWKGTFVDMHVLQWFSGL